MHRALRNILFLALATYTEGIRHKALWAIVCLAALLSMTNIAFTTLFSWDLGKVAIEFGLSAVAVTGLLLVFFLGLKILSDDLERSRILMILSKPVDCWHYLTGKFLGLVTVVTVSTIVLGGATALSMGYVLWQYSAFVPETFSWTVFTMALICQWLGLVVVLAVSMLCFSLASHSFVALLLAVGIYLIGQNMELLRRVVIENPYAGMLSGNEKVVLALSWIFPNLSLFDKKYEAAYGFSIDGTELLLLALYAFSYSSLMIFLANMLFKRKELG